MVWRNENLPNLNKCKTICCHSEVEKQMAWFDGALGGKQLLASLFIISGSAGLRSFFLFGGQLNFNGITLVKTFRLFKGSFGVYIQAFISPYPPHEHGPYRQGGRSALSHGFEAEAEFAVVAAYPNPGHQVGHITNEPCIG